MAIVKKQFKVRDSAVALLRELGVKEGYDEFITEKDGMFVVAMNVSNAVRQRTVPQDKVTVVLQPPMTKLCGVTGCGNIALADGRCGAHLKGR